MRTFIDALTERSFQNKTVAIIENGSWASTAGNVMKKMFEKSKNLTFTENNIKIKSAVSEENIDQIKALAKQFV